MGIGDFFKKLGKSPGKDESAEEAHSPAAPIPGRKAPMGLKLPGWAKKDNAFVPKDMGMMKPPEDMAEEASFKRPGAWLKNRLGGVADGEALENLEKTKDNRALRKGLSDQELGEFFEGLLGSDEEAAAEEARPVEKKE